MKLTPLAKLALIVVIVGGAASAYKFGYLDHKTQFSAPATQSLDTGTSQAQNVAQVTDTTTQVAPSAPVANFTPVTDSWQSITQNHVIRVSVENPSKPFYNDDHGTVTGFNYDFLKLLLKQPEFASLGPIQIDTKDHEVDTYKGVTDQLLMTNNGAPTVDMAMDGITRDDGDPAGVTYTNPYVTQFGYALITGPKSTARSIKDVDGQTIGILAGDPDVEAYVKRQFPHATIVKVSDSTGDDFIAQALDSARVDVFVYDYPFAVSSIAGTDLKFLVTHMDGSDFSYKIGVRGADQNLMLRLNSAIGRVMQTPEYGNLLRQYFISNQAVTTAATSSERTYIVKQGDTLNLIAASQMGAGNRYHEIQARNNLANPNLIMIGQHLVIPAK